MWFDGANGGTGYYGGADEKRSIQGSTYYDWPATLDLVRKMEPEVLFSVMRDRASVGLVMNGEWPAKPTGIPSRQTPCLREKLGSRNY